MFVCPLPYTPCCFAYICRCLISASSLCTSYTIDHISGFAVRLWAKSTYDTVPILQTCIYF
uniref:Uncharacterized protein n=1 Tax=Octopus bimaculoides TaxID=37653 RepID=A0A0L8IED3_OCTBM